MGSRIAGKVANWHNRTVASRTITRTGERRRGNRSAEPFLFLVFDCDRPLRPGARIRLGDARTVTIGRAEALCAEREAGGLRLGIADARISAAHLRLERVLGAWVAEDPGSKNGTLIDGRRIGRQQLADGSLLELGHTFLLFRESIEGGAGPALLDGRELKPAAAGLATLSPPFAAGLESLQRVAASPAPILLQGESGTGKGVMAAAIHRLSGRPGPLQAVNCGAIAPNLVESELFGHRKGAFSGAVEESPGLLRSADRGTLLLDEIGDLPLPAQAALLRALEEGEVLPVGATRPIAVDLRVIAATHRDLPALVAQERFREDLLARLSGYVCTLPPLRERREDFALLAAALLSRLGAGEMVFSAEAGRALLRHGWPLNVRELEKCLTAARALAAGGTVALEHLPVALRAAPAPAALPAEGAEVERRGELVALLEQHAGNVTAVARAMGKARTQVQRWLRRLRLDPGSFRR